MCRRPLRWYSRWSRCSSSRAGSCRPFHRGWCPRPAGAVGVVHPVPPLGLSGLTIMAPAWDAATLVGLGVPLYLVTMASQNLPGFAVLRASGYQPPTQPVLAITAAVSLGTAFLGARTS